MFYSALKKYKCYAPFHWFSAAHLKKYVKRTVSLHSELGAFILTSPLRWNWLFFLCLKFEHSLEGSNSQGYECVNTDDFLNSQPVLIYNKLSSPISPHFLMFYWKSMLQTCFFTSRSRSFSLICAPRKNPGTAGRKKD